METKQIVIIFCIALIIIAFILYIFVFKPQMQNYLLQRDIKAQQQIVSAIFREARAMGSVTLKTENDSMRLILYKE